MLFRYDKPLFKTYWHAEAANYCWQRNCKFGAKMLNQVRSDAQQEGGMVEQEVYTWNLLIWLSFLG